jgi:hypothetical protein
MMNQCSARIAFSLPILSLSLGRLRNSADALHLVGHLSEIEAHVIGIFTTLVYSGIGR